MRKSGELLKCGKHMGLQVRSLWFFVAEKRLQRSFGTAAVFCCDGCCDASLVTDCPAVTVRTPSEYCVLILQGDPVRVRNNRPLLCLAVAISQRACGINWVDHALTGECNLVCPYLRAGRLHSFYLCDDHKTVREGCK